VVEVFFDSISHCRAKKGAAMMIFLLAGAVAGVFALGGYLVSALRSVPNCNADFDFSDVGLEEGYLGRSGWRAEG
jgi:hypothetical protein